MTNDAKLGLVVGVILVIGTAVAFLRNDLVASKPPAGQQEMAVAAAGSARPNAYGAPATTTQATPDHHGHNHTVKFGESLFTLAQQYYGDGKKYVEIYRVNRRVVANPDYVPPGTVLFIPDLER